MDWLNFFSDEAGQARRRWLSEREEEIYRLLGPGFGDAVAGTGRAAVALSPMDDYDLMRQGVNRALNAEDWYDAALGIAETGAGATMALGPPALAMAAPRTTSEAIEGAARATADVDDIATDAVNRFWVDESGSVGGKSRFAPEVRARGDEVLRAYADGKLTDELLDMGDPALNAELNRYLYANSPVPMDEASRLARMEEMFPEAGYHGTGSNPAADAQEPNFTEFLGPNERTSHGTHIGTEGAANMRVLSRLDDFQREKMESAGMSPNDAVFDLVYRNENPLEMEDMIHWAPEDLVGRLEYMSDAGEMAPGFKVEPRVGKFGGEYFDNRDIVAELERLGYTGTRYKNLVEDVGRTSEAVFDPANIRSRFARFWPGTEHLKNLSAGMAGVGLYSVMGDELSPEASIEEIRAYLRGAGQ